MGGYALTKSKGVMAPKRELFELVRKLYVEQKLSRSTIHSQIGGNIRQVERAITKFRKEEGICPRYRAVSGEREELKRKVVELRMQGMTGKQIGEALGITLGTANGLLSRGVGYEKRVLISEEKQIAVRRMYESRWSDGDIAKELGWISSNAVRAFRRRHGILGRPQQHEYRGAQLDQIREMHFAGVTDEVIARELGFPSAIALYSFRKRKGIAKPRVRKPKLSKPRAKRVVASPAKPKTKAVIAMRRISVAPLMQCGIVIAHTFSIRRCQYPMWGDDGTAFNADGTPHFCDAPSAGSWCAEHHALVFKPSLRQLTAQAR